MYVLIVITYNEEDTYFGEAVALHSLSMAH